MQWIVFVIALIGAVLNIVKLRWCFVLWLVSNGFWLVHNIAAGDFPQAACYAIFFVISIWGFVAWKSKLQIDPPAVQSQKIRNAATRLAAAAGNSDNSDIIQEALGALMHQADVVETLTEIRKQKAKAGGKERS
jgi:hypothetical protein